MNEITNAVKDGDELSILYATRRQLAKQMDECENPHDFSSLTDKMQKLCERISELERTRKPKKKSALTAARKVTKQ